jgi:hypothetical protein
MKKNTPFYQALPLNKGEVPKAKGDKPPDKKLVPSNQLTFCNNYFYIPTK